ncbi:hypothetical protein C8035_v011672 [Colletotrichum spinosum]|uniref:Methyltransferase tdiE n=1 Tax=Colletotrichum spinosum TaxID=1347390 RepID=A0A4R8QG16_9PEZI|nr:hypothetical protein C8035_v011672 [Colletotrichum spinosum]
MHNVVQLLDGLEGLSLRLFYGVLGWTEKELLALLAQVRNEIKTGVVHTIFDFHISYGQKPAKESNGTS